MHTPLVVHSHYKATAEQFWQEDSGSMKEDSGRMKEDSGRDEGGFGRASHLIVIHLNLH